MLHINAPPVTERRRFILPCPTCRARRRTIGRNYEWYGWHLTCLGCGDEWEDGEMLPRPFAPGWRRKNMEKARREWAACPRRS